MGRCFARPWQIQCSVLAIAETDSIQLSQRELFNLSGLVEIILVLPVTSVWVWSDLSSQNIRNTHLPSTTTQPLIKSKCARSWDCVCHVHPPLHSSASRGTLEADYKVGLMMLLKTVWKTSSPHFTRWIILGNMKSWLHCTNFSKSDVFMKALLIPVNHCWLSQSSHNSVQKGRNSQQSPVSVNKLLLHQE